METERNNIQNEDNKRKIGAWPFLLMITIMLASIFGAIFGFMANGIAGKLFPNVLKNNYPVLDIGKDIIRQRVIEEDSAVIDVVEKSSPAVVSIVVTKDMPKIQQFNPFDFPFFLNPLPGSPFEDQGDSDLGDTEKQKIGGGSGFIISNDGMIVTNRHVVDDDGAEYTVITNDNKEYSAKVLAKDSQNDFAVVKIEGDNHPVLSLGNSDSLKIGQTVIAIGNSLGEFSNTVSKGIISGLRRNLTAGNSLGASESLKNIIQTDAAINFGNSGGPLLNINGEVIGINVAKAQGAENIGFAIPVNQIIKTIDQVKKTGKISTPYLGVRYFPIDSQLQKEINLPFDYGVLVSRGEKITDFAVIPGSPADKAEIVENDIILEVNGEKADKNNSLADLISKYAVGDEITLKIWHKGNTKNIKVKLEERK